VTGARSPWREEGNRAARADHGIPHASSGNRNVSVASIIVHPPRAASHSHEPRPGSRDVPGTRSASNNRAWRRWCRGHPERGRGRQDRGGSSHPKRPSNPANAANAPGSRTPAFSKLPAGGRSYHALRPTRGTETKSQVAQEPGALARQLAPLGHRPDRPKSRPSTCRSWRKPNRQARGQRAEDGDSPRGIALLDIAVPEEFIPARVRREAHCLARSIAASHSPVLARIWAVTQPA
jgi:hypothetical protein